MANKSAQRIEAETSAQTVADETGVARQLVAIGGQWMHFPVGTGFVSNKSADRIFHPRTSAEKTR